MFNTHVNDTSDRESTPEDGTSEDNGDSTVSQQAEFPAELPTIRRLPNQSDALFDEGYDSDGELPFYDPIALEEDADDFFEAFIDSATPDLTPAPETRTADDVLPEAVDLTEEVAGVEGMGVDSFVVGVEEGAGDLEEVAIEKYTIRSS